MSFLDDYEPVEDRLAKFWADHPEGQIVTEMIPAPEGQWIVKASVWRTGLHILAGDLLTNEATSDIRAVMNIPDATGHAQEHVTEKGVNSTSALENCETSAIGRALANLGYAAKGKRPSREEMVKVKESGEPSVPAHATWLADAVGVFKAWDEEQRRVAYQTAMTNLAFDALTNMDEAKRIFDHMAGQYQERPIEQLPLEGESTK